MTNTEVLQKMSEDFMLRRSSDKTISTYKTLIEGFRRFSGKDNYADLDESDLRRYLIHLRANGLMSDSATNTANSACKFMLRVVLNQKINDSQVPNARTHHKMQIYFSREQLTAFFAVLDNITSFAFFLTLYGTGARLKEITEIRTSDIEHMNGSHFLRIRHGKGNKERLVSLPDACYRALRLYWKYQKPGNSQNLMFPDRTGSANLKPSHFTAAFRAALNDSRLGKELHPHCLRHTYAHNVMQNNPNNILTLKNSLGHSSIASTEIYLKSSSIDMTNTSSPDEICRDLFDAFIARHEF